MVTQVQIALVEMDKEMKIVFEIILRLSWLLNIQEKEEKLLSIFFFSSCGLSHNYFFEK